MLAVRVRLKLFLGHRNIFWRIPFQEVRLSPSPFFFLFFLFFPSAQLQLWYIWRWRFDERRREEDVASAVVGTFPIIQTLYSLTSCYSQDLRMYVPRRINKISSCFLTCAFIQWYVFHWVSYGSKKNWKQTKCQWTMEKSELKTLKEFIVLKKRQEKTKKLRGKCAIYKSFTERDSRFGKVSVNWMDSWHSF